MGKIRVLCGGHFRKIHGGHIYFLKKAKSFGDYLIVVISNDKLHLKKYRGDFIPAQRRKKNLEKIKIADEVVIGANPVDYNEIIKKFKPDIVVLGYDQNIKLNIPKLKILRVGKF
jgi:cytidyltransferase-like protein